MEPRKPCEPAAAPPRVGVVLCARDAQDTLAEALESLRTQTFADFGCLVIDDGSRDRTAEIAEGVAALDARFTLERQPARGLTPSLRAGVAATGTELVARMDADDVALPERFARQVAYLDAHPGCVAVGGAVLVVDAERRPLYPELAVQGHDAIVARLLQGQGGVVRHPTLMARREAVLAAGSYRDAYPTAQDLDLFLRLAEVGELANLPELVLEYRVHPGAVSQRRTADQYAAAAHILRDAYARRGLPDPPTPTPTGPRPGAETWAHWARASLAAGYRRSSLRYALAAVRAEPSARHLYLLGRALLGWRTA